MSIKVVYLYSLITEKVIDMVHEILNIIRKDLQLEWLKVHSIGSLVLYMFAMIFIIYLVFPQMSVMLWNVLYWIIVLFASVQIGSKSFEEESRGRKYYYFQLASSESYYIAKLLQNTILFLIFQLLCYFGLWVISGIAVDDYGVFMLTNLLASIGLAGVLTFTSGAASDVNQNVTLMSILSFPLMIPVLLQSVSLNTNAIGMVSDTNITSDFMLLAAIDLVLISIGLGLFPYLWQE